MMTEAAIVGSVRSGTGADVGKATGAVESSTGIVDWFSPGFERALASCCSRLTVDSNSANRFHMLMTINGEARNQTTTATKISTTNGMLASL